MPIRVGDIRQLISTSDSSTLLTEVLGRVKREDGELTFRVETKVGENSIIFVDHYLIKDGYFMFSELDTTDRNVDLRINPFFERRFARIYPKDGEKFKFILGFDNDIFLITKREEQVETFCGIFKDVFSFTTYNSTQAYPEQKYYYAKGIGYVAIYEMSFGLTYLASYLKVGDQTIGELWPEK